MYRIYVKIKKLNAVNDYILKILKKRVDGYKGNSFTLV